MHLEKMANTRNKASIIEHDYSMDGIREACFEESVEEEIKVAKTLSDHTPIQSPHPKKQKKRDDSREVSMESIQYTKLFTLCHKDLRRDWMRLKKSLKTLKSAYRATKKRLLKIKMK